MLLTGAGLPDPSSGAVNDLYIDLVTDNLYRRTTGGWTLLGNLSNPGGTLNGWNWFSLVYPTATGNTVTGAVYSADRVAATITVTGALGDGGGGGVGWHFSDPPSPANLAGYSYLRFNLDLTITAGSVDRIIVTLGENGMWGCEYSQTVTSGANVVAIGLGAPPSNCWSEPGITAPDPMTFYPSSIDTVTIGIPYDETGIQRIVNLSVSNVRLVW